MKNEEQEEFDDMIKGMMQELIGQNTYEDLKECMQTQTNNLRSIAINSYPQHFINSGIDKQRILESIEYLNRIIDENNLKYDDWGIITKPQISEIKYLKGISYVLNGYYNPNPVIEILTNAKKGIPYKRAPKDLNMIQYTYELDKEGIPVRTILNDCTLEDKNSLGYYLRQTDEEIFILFDAFDKRIKSVYRAIRNKGVVIRYEELFCCYDNSGNSAINNLEAYDIAYENGEVDKFTHFRYDGSENIFFETFTVDPTGGKLT